MKKFLLLAFLIIAGALLFWRGDISILADMSTFEIIIVAGGLLLMVVYVLTILGH